MLSTHISHQIYAKLSFEATFNQKKIIEKLSEWLSSEEHERIFLLNGYAGTGKTTIIAAFVAALKELGIKPILLAPTGRAAKVRRDGIYYPQEDLSRALDSRYRLKIFVGLQSREGGHIYRRRGIYALGTRCRGCCIRHRQPPR